MMVGTVVVYTCEFKGWQLKKRWFKEFPGSRCHPLKNGGSSWMMMNPYYKKMVAHKPTYKKWWLDFQGLYTFLYWVICWFNFQEAKFLHMPSLDGDLLSLKLFLRPRQFGPIFRGKLLLVLGRGTL